MNLVHRLSAIALIFLGAGFFVSSAFGSECHEGVWDLTTSGKTPDGQSYTGKATSTRYCLFDGAAHLDEYRALSPDGNVVFLGASIDFPSNNNQRVQTLWVMGGDPGYTLIDGKIMNDRLVSTGKGFDAGGEFLERSETVFSGDRNYIFEMDRSYDGGTNWIESFSKSEATYRTSEVPPLPADYHPILQQGRDAIANPPEGTIILDGFASIEELNMSLDGTKVPTIRFSSRYMNPDRWQSYYWSLGSDHADVREIEIHQSN